MPKYQISRGNQRKRNHRAIISILLTNYWLFLSISYKYEWRKNTFVWGKRKRGKNEKEKTGYPDINVDRIGWQRYQVEETNFFRLAHAPLVSSPIFSIIVRSKSPWRSRGTDDRSSSRETFISARSAQAAEFYVRDTGNIWKFARVKVDYQVTGNGQLIPRPLG